MFTSVSKNEGLGVPRQVLYVEPGRLAGEAVVDQENAVDLGEASDYSTTFSLEGGRRVI
jgi:hypothetical protein